MEFFAQIGSQIEHRWREQHYEENCFPGIAAEALEEARTHEKLGMWEIMHWVQHTHDLPRQHDLSAKFGEPPITLYNGVRFHIDIYFWLDGTTSIHQHAFSGAFQVMLGSSIHSRYGFRQGRKINSHMIIGDIDFCDTELLQIGDVRKIYPGNQFIHSLFHLDRPSMTLIARSYTNPEYTPQYDYFKPHLAWNPFYQERHAIRRQQVVSMLLKLKQQEAFPLVKEMLTTSDYQTTFALLKLIYEKLLSERSGPASGPQVPQVPQVFDCLSELINAARRTHGELVDLIPPILEEQYRQFKIVRLRSSLFRSEHRFLLALLLNIPERSHILKMIESHFPGDDAVDKIIQLLKEISAETKIISPQYFEGDNLYIIRKLFEGYTSDQIKESYGEVLSAGSSVEIEKQIDEIYELSHRSSLLRSALAIQAA